MVLTIINAIFELLSALFSIFAGIAMMIYTCKALNSSGQARMEYLLIATLTAIWFLC